jgi:hypothetical protein
MVVGMDRTRHPTRRLRTRSLRTPGAKDVLIADAVRRGRRERRDKPPVRREPYRRIPPGELAKELTPELDGELAEILLLSLGRRLVAAAERSIARNAQMTLFGERAAAGWAEDAIDDCVARAA